MSAQRYLSIPPQRFAATTAPSDPDDVTGWSRFFEDANAAIVEAFSDRRSAGAPLERGGFELDDVRTHVLRPQHVPDSRTRRP